MNTNVNFVVFDFERMHIIVILLDLVCQKVKKIPSAPMNQDQRTTLDTDDRCKQVVLSGRLGGILSVVLFFLFLLRFLSPRNDQITPGWCFGRSEERCLYAVVRLRCNPCFTNNAIFEQYLQGFRMTRLDEVSIVLQDQLDFPVTQCAISDEGNDGIWDRNLGDMSLNLLIVD